MYDFKISICKSSNVLRVVCLWGLNQVMGVQSSPSQDSPAGGLELKVRVRFRVGGWVYAFF